jgi:LysM repeat protein
MSKIFGIDISVFQKGINLAKAKNEGVKFAIIRAGYTGSSNGVSKAKDTQFETHYKNAKANGLGVGAYWFSRATTYENGKLEAEYMYNNCLKGKKFEYPICIDVEDSKYQSKASKKQVANAIKGFCEYLESKGYYVGIYANVNWFKNKIDTASLNRYDKWVACWSKTRPSFPECGMWQFGGETNKIRSNKIAGMVCDQNYAFKDYANIIKKAGLNGFTKETTNTSSEVKKPENTANTSSNVSNYKTHKVVKGETLSGIAKKYGTTYQELAKYNGISNPNIINVGQVIKIPNTSKVTTAPKVVTYIVKSGDTLSSIAKKYKTTWQKIYNDNKSVIGSNPDVIKVGQKLVIK